MTAHKLMTDSGNDPAENPLVAERLIVGRIGAPHGVRGWVKVHSFTEPRDQLLDYQPLWIQRGGQWQELELAEYRSVDAGLLVRVVGVDDRDEAALLRNCDISIAETQLPELESGEYYWQQLIGLEVVSCFEEHEYRLGTVISLLETGANDVLVVQGDTNSLDSRQRLIPYGDQFLGRVDLVKGRIEVNWDPSF